MIPATRNIGAGASNITTTDNILNIDTTLGAAVLTLPSIATWFDLKNKSGSIYDADGLRFTDVSGTAGTNNITFVAAVGDNINGSASIIVNTNGASGVITPNLDGGTWESSSVGAVTGTGEYNVFGTVLIDNIFAPSLDLIGLKHIYAPNGEKDSQGAAINIGGTGTIVATVSMPDLVEVYGSCIITYNALLDSVNIPELTLVTGVIEFSSNPSIATLNLPALVTVIENIIIANNISLTAISIGTALNCTQIDFTGNALTGAAVDAILANVDTAGFSRVIIDYNTLVGTFQVGEVITGGTSGATAVIVSNDGYSIVDNTVLGVFQVGEIITGATSGATANTAGVTQASLNLSGGTNATPSVAGLVSKANLEAKGWIVTTN